jgi:hypothetical protein
MLAGSPGDLAEVDISITAASLKKPTDGGYPSAPTVPGWHLAHRSMSDLLKSEIRVRREPPTA